MCNKEYNSYAGLSAHIRQTHKEITLEEYYNKYICNDSSTCKKCDKKLTFYGLIKGYKNAQHCFVCSKRLNSTTQRRRETFLKKYGVEHISQLEEIKNKKKKTLMKNYGVDSPLKNKEIYKKVIIQIENKYGVDNVFKSEEIKEKIRKTNLKKYGCENPNQSKKIKNKSKNTNIEKYGCENPQQNKEVREKTIKTNLKKYGVKNYTKTEEYKLKQKQKFYDSLVNENRIPNLEPLFNVNDFIGSCNEYKFKCKVCGNEFEDHLANGRVPRCLVCFPYDVSSLEREIREFIQTIYTGELIFNDRIIIKPKELDIVLPDLKVAIEVNGNYYHTEAFGRGDDYHQMKIDSCEKAGYKLYFIWENEWEENREEVINNIKNILMV
jgi:very-short-patch-repair endonuclease